MKTHASLFTGIGGFDLAAEASGFTNVFAVEKDKYCKKIIKQNFPDTTIYGDICTTGGIRNILSHKIN